MNYKVCIVDTATGEERVKEAGVPWGEGTIFWWSMGNYACDCNREWEFARAGGMPEKQVMELNGPCGHTRFHVPWLEVNGERIVIDAPEKARA